jgi:pyruvate,water dikinase
MLVSSRAPTESLSEWFTWVPSNLAWQLAIDLLFPYWLFLASSMTRLPHLAQLSSEHRAAVGDKAFYLGHLKQNQLPVTDGWLLPANVWLRYLENIAWPHPDLISQLDQLAAASPSVLQQTCQAMQQAMLSTPILQEIIDRLPSIPGSAWILRASLCLPSQVPPHEQQSRMPTLRGLLPAYIGLGGAHAMAMGLQQFWSQALTAANLVVWQHHCQSLFEVGLATLLTPVYPAAVAGTLTLTEDGLITVEVVQGLGLALSTGEAIPARCQFSTLDAIDQVRWHLGQQEYQYNLAIAGKHQEQAPLQVVTRPTTDLASPLLPEHLAQLMDLGYQAKALLPWDNLLLEWLLYPDGAEAQLTPLITQVSPALPSVSRPHPSPTPEVTHPPAQGLQPPPLPAISVVVRGIGASAGCSQAPVVVAEHMHDLPAPLPEGCIVVLPELQPDIFFQLQSVTGIVTEKGGATCHAAILAREVGIPAVVGAPHATQLLAMESYLWMDGERGVVYGLNSEYSLIHRSFSSPGKRDRGRGLSPSPFDVVPGQHLPLTRTKVMVNLSQPRQLTNLPIDQIAGIGLLRSEWLMLNVLEGRHPWHWIQQGQGAELQTRIAQQLEPILRALGNKPVRYRTLDLRSHEWQALEGSPPLEPNPMLGLRGTLSYDADSRLFEVELLALKNLQQAGYDNIQLMLPFVRTVEEVIVCRQRMAQIGLDDSPNFALWIMAEVPSVLFLLPAYAKAGVQGIAIGSNDLTQLLLAVDRDQPLMASAYDERHPVVRMAIAHLIQQARQCRLTCSICGQAPVRHPEFVQELVSLGIDSISVEGSALPFIRQAVWQAEQSV